MAEKEAPKIEFPCEDYPIKVLGDASDEMVSLVNEVMTREAPGYDASRNQVKGSRNGRFQSITVWVTATGEPQLKRIHESLSASPMIKMVM